LAEPASERLGASHPDKEEDLGERPQTVALLQSPFTANPLHLVSEEGTETLIRQLRGAVPVRDGIPAFLKPET